MGITIHYRGRLKDPGAAERFGAELVERAATWGAEVRLRAGESRSDDDGVRGAVLHLHADCESVCLLVSRQGWLMSAATLAVGDSNDEEAWVSCKTSFAPEWVHMRLVELLDWVMASWIPDLEVHDEGEYFETRDLDLLRGRRAILERAMGMLEEGLGELEGSDEGSQDPDGLADRIAQAAGGAHERMKRTAH